MQTIALHFQSKVLHFSLRILNHCFDFSCLVIIRWNVEAALKTFLKRAIANGQTTLGLFEGGSRNSEDLNIKKYVY